MTWVVFFVGALVAGLAVVFAVVLMGIRWMGRRRMHKLLDSLDSEQVLALANGANFFGLESAGLGQVRGNGSLVLTDRRLLFEMWIPRRRISIPLHQIQTVETPRAFLGKTRFRRLLKVSFSAEAGQYDAAAWGLGNLHDFWAALQDALKSNRSGML